jgi:hypothetical protein
MSFLRRPAIGACIAAAIAALGWSTAAQAQVSVTTADGNGADTYLSNDSSSGPGDAHGDSDVFELRSITDSRARIGMLRFDLSDVTGDLTGATLSFEFTNSRRARTWEIYGLNDGSDDLWNELTTSYGSGVGVLSATEGNYALDVGSAANQVTLLGTMAVSDAETEDTDPTAHEGLNTSSTASLDLSSFLAADSNGLVTLLLAFPSGTDTNPDWFVATKENTLVGSSLTAPTLTLPNASPVPEPATAGFVLLAGAGLVAARRRRR